jgi:IS1 family transposase/transposase-like protein
MNCIYCKQPCIKKGIRNGIQKLFCKHCKTYQQEKYKIRRVNKKKANRIVLLNNEGLGISSISRLLSISKSTVINWMKKIANVLIKPREVETNQDYEIDEMVTYIGKKSPANYTYIIYAINKSTGKIIDFFIGRRTKENIKKVVDKVMQLSPHKIFTDGLNIYPTLISSNIHYTMKHCINRIERFNLILRTHIKRLNRKTICYSKCIEMLKVCVKLYMLRRYLPTSIINLI